MLLSALSVLLLWGVGLLYFCRSHVSPKGSRKQGGLGLLRGKGLGSEEKKVPPTSVLSGTRPALHQDILPLQVPDQLHMPQTDKWILLQWALVSSS